MQIPEKEDHTVERVSEEARAFLKGKIALVMIIALMLSVAVSPVQGHKETKSSEDYILDLQDKDAKVLGEAAWALGKTGDSKANDPLIRALSDKQSNVRDWSILALMKIGKPAIDR
jgi:hypothetical protein